LKQLTRRKIPADRAHQTISALKSAQFEAQRLHFLGNVTCQTASVIGKYGEQVARYVIVTPTSGRGPTRWGGRRG
jgi:hypothetical protein